MAHKRVDEIVAHIAQHPIKIDGYQMYYQKISDLPAGRLSIEVVLIILKYLCIFILL